MANIKLFSKNATFLFYCTSHSSDQSKSVHQMIIWFCGCYKMDGAYILSPPRFWMW